MLRQIAIIGKGDRGCDVRILGPALEKSQSRDGIEALIAFSTNFSAYSASPRS